MSKIVNVHNLIISYYYDMSETLFSTTIIDKHNRSSDVITILHNYKIVEKRARRKKCSINITCPITNKNT